MPKYATADSLQREFAAQFNRLDFYAQNFTKFLANPPFPPEDPNESDRSLFQVPQILDAALRDASTHVGLHPEAWTRDPLISKSFHENGDFPYVSIGEGTTRSGKKIDIATYERIIVEAATGKKLRVTVDFDLNELEKQARLQE